MPEQQKLQSLVSTVQLLMAPGKGLLAADESAATVEKRFAPIHLENTEDNRRAFRELFFTAPEIEQYISGVILFDETIRQKASSGEMFVSILQKQGIVPGIKVDLGVEAMEGHPNEKVTKGLVGLEGRMSEYYGLGARFAKWRSVITIGQGCPSEANIIENMTTLAAYAKICQAAGIVPIVEPEVIMDGSHTLEHCAEVTAQVEQELFRQLKASEVALEGLILKSNMVIAGKDCPVQPDSSAIAKATLETFTKNVPSNIGGIVFLSGGQSEKQSTKNLNEMHKQSQLPWPLTFSYARALQDSATKTWSGKPENVKKAQEVFIHRATMNSLASLGTYEESIEMESVESFGESQASQD